MNRIVVDVAGLKHVDSTLLRLLVKLTEHVARDQSATVELVGATPRLRRILDTVGLARAFVFTGEL
jgi:anti-anti-sigma factor